MHGGGGEEGAVMQYRRILHCAFLSSSPFAANYSTEVLGSIKRSPNFKGHFLHFESGEKRKEH